MDGNDSDGSGNGLEERQNPNLDGEHDSGGAVGAGSGVFGLGGSREHDDDDESDSTSSDSSEESDEERPYDISIAASHSYLGGGLVPTGGRAVLEAGWRGRVPAAAHHGVVFPGETVPMLLPHAPDAALLVQAIRNDKLFGLLCPDESGSRVSGYGVLCEVVMAGVEQQAEQPTSITFKARAIHRFRQLSLPKSSDSIHDYTRMRFVEVMVMPEMSARDTLRAASLASLDPLRTPDHCAPVQQRLRALDAAATPWPRFVFDMFELARMRRTIRAYYASMAMADYLPEEPVTLSFWVASNLPLTVADRLALFTVDSALVRLHMECHFIKRESVLCCSSCTAEIAHREHIFAMSSEGVHSNYTNFSGYMHDILTVSQTSNVETHGAPSAEFSWFPGYTWTIATCAGCMAHVGWRFEALKRNLRPYQFYGLCRNYVQPHAGERVPPPLNHDELEELHAREHHQRPQPRGRAGLRRRPRLF